MKKRIVFALLVIVLITQSCMTSSLALDSLNEFYKSMSLEEQIASPRRIEGYLLVGFESTDEREWTYAEKLDVAFDALAIAYPNASAGELSGYITDYFGYNITENHSVMWCLYLPDDSAVAVGEYLRSLTFEDYSIWVNFDLIDVIEKMGPSHRYEGVLYGGLFDALEGDGSETMVATVLETLRPYFPESEDAEILTHIKVRNLDYDTNKFYIWLNDLPHERLSEIRALLSEQGMEFNYNWLDYYYDDGIYITRWDLFEQKCDHRNHGVIEFYIEDGTSEERIEEILIAGSCATMLSRKEIDEEVAMYERIPQPDGSTLYRRSGISEGIVLKLFDRIGSQREVYEISLPHEHDVIIGDCNGDGIVDALDYAVLKRVCLETLDWDTSSDGICAYTMDVNGDELFDTLDYALLKRMVLGTYTPE